LAQTNKLIKQETLDRLGLTGAYDKLSRARAEAKVKLRDLIIAEGESSKAVKAATKEFEALDIKVRKADKAVGDFTKNVGNYPTLTGLKNTLKDLVGAFGVATGAAAFAAVLADAYKTIKKFEQGVADLSAITGASGKDLDFLKNAAIDLGKTVAGGAIAVVEAYKLIAGAKPELLSNVKALNQVTEAAITLSQAAGMELPAAATALTDAMNQFGAGADQAQVFIDALANGAKFGSAEIPQLTEALLKFGAVARSTNVNIKESAALVELLAENGLKGADAGTALRNVLLKLSAPDALPRKAQEELNGLGISMDKLKDKTLPIQERLEMLKPLLKDNASIVKVFGVENATAAINVIEHTDRLKELTTQMGEVGTAEEQATIRMNTLTGKTEQLKSTYDSLVLSIGEGSGAISEFFKFWIDGAKSALEGMIRLNTSWDDLFEKAKLQGSADGAKVFVWDGTDWNELSTTGSIPETYFSPLDFYVTGTGDTVRIKRGLDTSFIRGAYRVYEYKNGTADSSLVSTPLDTAYFNPANLPNQGRIKALNDSIKLVTNTALALRLLKSEIGNGLKYDGSVLRWADTVTSNTNINFLGNYFRLLTTNANFYISSANVYTGVAGSNYSSGTYADNNSVSLINLPVLFNPVDKFLCVFIVKSPFLGLL